LFCKTYILSTHPGKFLCLETQNYPQRYKDFLKRQFLNLRFYDNGFAKTSAQQRVTIFGTDYTHLTPVQKEQILANFEETDFHGGQFPKTKEG
jgi:hypothetical protein